MINSGDIATLMAHVVFWAILAVGVGTSEIGLKTAAIFLCLWAIGWFGLPYLSSFAGLFLTPYIAVLDIVLALVVFKGDVRLR